MVLVVQLIEGDGFKLALLGSAGCLSMAVNPFFALTLLD
jgi:hypothetical protein